MTYDELKQLITNTLEFAKAVMQAINDNWQELEGYDTRLVTLFQGDEPKVEGRYLSKGNKIQIRTYFGKTTTYTPLDETPIEQAIEALATVLYDYMDLYGEDGWLKWLGEDE